MIPGAMAGLLLCGAPCSHEKPRRGSHAVVVVLMGSLRDWPCCSRTSRHPADPAGRPHHRTGAAHWRARPLLAAVPLLALTPMAMLMWTPLGATVRTSRGGLAVPWWTALGEVVLGLWTVWPMTLGVVMALLWWPGLVRSFTTPQRWVAVAWG